MRHHDSGRGRSIGDCRAVAETAEEPLLIRTEGRLGRITLHRPRQIDALTFPMITGVRRAPADWVDDRRVAVRLIDGSGSADCAPARTSAASDQPWRTRSLGRTVTVSGRPTVTTSSASPEVIRR